VDFRVDHRSDSSSDGHADLRRGLNGANASRSRGTTLLTANHLEQHLADDSGQAIAPVASSGDDSENVTTILRGGALAIIAFQIGYVLLDGGEYPQTFARTTPFHIASVILGLLAMAVTMSPRAMRSWRTFLLVIFLSVLASTARIAVINSDSDVLVASIVLFFFSAGALVPWSPRWQAALEGSGALALFAYSIQSADPASSLTLDWMRLLSAALVSHASAVHFTRYRIKLVAALLENHRLLTREMELREESARTRELEHSKWQQTDSMLRKVFEASPDNVAVNSLLDGRFIAVNDDYQVGGYTRDDVIGSTVLALGMWAHEEELARFVESLQKTGRVKEMEITQRRKDGSVELNLISASAVEVNGESCAISMTRDITEIKRSELRLRNSHSALRKILHATLDVIVVSRVSDGSFIDFNTQFGQSGFTPDDLNDAVTPSPRVFKNVEQQRALRELVLAEGVVRNVEVEFLLPDGRTTPTMLSAVRVELDGEDCVVTMIRDLTAAKEASRKIEESTQAVRDIFDVSPDAISVSRVSDGKFVAFNDEFLRLSGYTREQAMSSSALELGMWVDPADRIAFVSALARDEMVRSLEIEFQTNSHVRVPILISATMINLGSELCVAAYIRDITAMKQNERDLMSAREEMSRHVKALSDSEETFRKLFDANLDSMTLSGADGIYINVNREFVRSTGFSREDAIGHHFTELNMWIHPDEMMAFSEQLTRTNEVRNIEVAFRNKDGSEQPVLISALNLELHGQMCCLSISRGISDLKMTQRELVGAREAALAASRAKSEFLSSMSHEIRTPMNAILGMADLLAEADLGDEQRRYVNTLIGNGNALLELINGILDLAKVESGRISLEAVEFDPHEVTEKVLETLAIRAHEKGLELMVRFAPGVPDVAIGDPLRLGQILINLVGNAIKFTQKGQVLVSIEPDPNSTTAGGLKFAVTDTGIGIPADKIDLLFHAFTQADSSTSRKYGGSGLGLAIVSRLVALMHGKVEVASEPGSGSSFSFTAQFGTANGDRQALSSHEQTFAGVGILLVDDNSDNRSILSELLRAQGADVTELASGTEALAELRRAGSQDSPFQIVLLDSTMPVLGGFDTAKQLISGMPEHPQIVMMLGTDDLTSKLGRLRALGVDNYVVKPVRRADLFAAIARAGAKVQVELQVPPRGLVASPVLAPVPASSPMLDRPLRILIADDSHDNRALIEAYLKKTPYLLIEAEDGQQAIDKFIAGRFDLVLMDIQMPNVDGYEATEKIRGWEREHGRRRTPVVALTASALEDAADRTRAAGCDAHVTKPVKKSTLLNAIRDAVERNPRNDEHADPPDLKEEICQTE